MSKKHNEHEYVPVIFIKLYLQESISKQMLGPLQRFLVKCFHYIADNNFSSHCTNSLYVSN